MPAASRRGEAAATTTTPASATTEDSRRAERTADRTSWPCAPRRASSCSTGRKRPKPTTRATDQKTENMSNAASPLAASGARAATPRETMPRKT
jgi:hypothetical protein